MSQEKQEKTSFSPSRYTIKVKLIGIISLVIFAALSGMIFSASAFFSDISESNIQENNFNLVRVTAEWTESELRYITNEVYSMLPDLPSKFAPQFFKKNPEFIYLGLSQDARNFSKQIYNQQLMESNKLSAESIKKIHQLNYKYIKTSLIGQFTLFNASQEKHALLALCQKTASGFLLLYMDPERLLRGFETQKTLSMFMVNEKGDVILHPDPKTILARSNFLEKEIVKKMWQAPVTTGQMSYQDKTDKTFYLASYKKLSTGAYGLIAQISADIVFEPTRIIRDRNLILMGIFLTLSIVIVYFFAKLISSPIISLLKATREIEEGNYDLSIKPRSRDEVGQLTHAFCDMAQGLSEREKMKDAFGKFVNKELAEQAMRGEIRLGGERKKTAIFFSDLRGFTALSESLKAEEVVAFLNSYFTEMVNCVLQTHGVVDKYIGDAIMAHWGAVGGRGNHSENAINASLLMRKALIAFNKKHKGRFPHAKIGCGINTGPVISGQIGSEERLEYTVIGDPVNLASRIEALNKPFGTDILISEDAYNDVKGIYKLAAMPSINVKGKVKPQRVFAVLGRHDDPKSPSGLAEVRALLGIEFTKGVSARDRQLKEKKFEILSKK